MDRVRVEMPEDPPHRPRGWAIGVAGLVAIALYVVVAYDLLGDVQPERVDDVREAVAIIGCELVVVASFWAMRSSASPPAILSSLARRAAATAIVGAVVIAMVGFRSFLGCGFANKDPLPSRMHLHWLAFAFLWSIAVGAFIHAANGVVDALRRRAATRETAKRFGGR